MAPADVPAELQPSRVREPGPAVVHGGLQALRPVHLDRTAQVPARGRPERHPGARPVGGGVGRVIDHPVQRLMLGTVQRGQVAEHLGNPDTSTSTSV